MTPIGPLDGAAGPVAGPAGRSRGGYVVKLNQLTFTKSDVLPEKTR
jgi:hypothetical protein